ncbi:hypothetical protein, partial [Escherichia coli]|uniref:hypothetical protein n=1 Tax=Escherichia coli TaxID=562 RepID=UPI001EDA5151
MGNKIAPLKNNFLRETAKELMFKYGEESEDIKINMIAKVTRVISSTSMPDLSQGDPFFEFPQILNAILGPIGIINKGDLVVSPIAIS